MSERKCKGCGIPLQSEDPKAYGYIRKDDQAYCQRCYRLIHYGERKDLGKRYVKNKDVLDIYEKYSSDVIVLVIDVYEVLFSDISDLLDRFDGHRVIFVLSKCDLLPEGFSQDILQERVTAVLKKYAVHIEIVDLLLTSSKDPGFPSFFKSVLDDHKLKKAVFAGRANAGKSSLINRLLGNDDLTVSRYPGTTLSDVVIKDREYTYIDTPGLYDPENILSYIPMEKAELLTLSRSPRPRNFQIYEPQSYFMEGLLRIDVFPKKTSTLIIHMSPLLEVHRTKAENADRYFDRNKKDLSLKFDTYSETKKRYKGTSIFYIKGLGLFRIVGEGEVRLHTYDKMKVIQSEVFI